MTTYIRDGDGNLCQVLFETSTFYHAERVKDKSKIAVPRNSAKEVKVIEPFPGDWAIKSKAA